MKTINTNKWKFGIEIKHLFEDEVTPELITKLCGSMACQLQDIQNKVEKSNLVQDEKDHVSDKLDDLISNYEFLKDLSSGNIKRKEWSNYSFTGNFQEWFNDYLHQTYDLGDTRVKNINNQTEKFIWVN